MFTPMRAAAAPIVAMIGFAACGEPAPFDFDPHPIPYDVSTGAITMPGNIPSLGARLLVLDTAAPITVIDDGDVLERRLLVVELKNGDATRVRFTQVSGILSPLGSVGEGTPTPIGGVLGGDLL